MKQKIFYKFSRNQVSEKDFEQVVCVSEQYTNGCAPFLLLSSFALAPEFVSMGSSNRLAVFQQHRLRVISAKRLSESMLQQGVVIAFNTISAELSYKLALANVVIYVGVRNSDIEKWLTSREAVCLDTNVALTCPQPSRIVAKAIDWLSDTCNVASNFTHPFDEDKLKVVANALHEAGEPIDECAIFSYCKKCGWMEKPIYTCMATFIKAQASQYKTEGQYTKESLFKIWDVRPEDMQEKCYLQSFVLESMWGYKTVEWNDINEDVNIVVGINGVGKTTLLDAIYTYYTGAKSTGKTRIRESVPTANLAFPMSYVRTADTPALGKSVKESRLTQELNGVIMQNKAGKSFFNYFMRQLYEKPEDAQIIKNNTDDLFQIINEFFKETGKTIDVDKSNNSYLSFRIEGREDVINHTQLSSGEKQLLLILIKVFLQEKQPAIILMDEPEQSLHICWQQQLIEAIRLINPNCQLIITTHSPSILSQGWSDKIVYMDKIVK